MSHICPVRSLTASVHNSPSRTSSRRRWSRIGEGVEVLVEEGIEYFSPVTNCSSLAFCSCSKPLTVSQNHCTTLCEDWLANSPVYSVFAIQLSCNTSCNSLRSQWFDRDASPCRCWAGRVIVTLSLGNQTLPTKAQEPPNQQIKFIYMELEVQSI